MPTWRHFTKRPYQCGYFEAQDVLVDIDDVDLIGLRPGKRFGFQDPWHRRLLYHDISRTLVSINPGLQGVKLTQDYDLFVVLCQNVEEVLYLSAIDGWRDRCKTTVCVIEEIWEASLPNYRYWLHALRQFDHVLICTGGSVSALSSTIGKPCLPIPGAVDALRFSPHPAPPRAIDVYSLGRRAEGIHQALLKMAASSGMFYVHDTLNAGATHVLDPQDHRNQVANLAKRSRYFLVAPAKMNNPRETVGQVEVGPRYYEGAAAGCVLLGQSADSDAFRQLFDWPDVVMEVNSDGSDVADVLAGLNADPQRLCAIGRRNARECLLRHDWLYRWKYILQIAGMAPSEGMHAREARLKDVASAFA